MQLEPEGSLETRAHIAAADELGWDEREAGVPARTAEEVV